MKQSKDEKMKQEVHCMQKNLEPEKTAEKTDIDGKKDKKRKSHIKEELRLIRLEHHFTKFRMAVLPLRPRREYQL